MSSFDAAPHIARAMRLVQSATAKGKEEQRVEALLTIVDGYNYNTQTGNQTPNIISSGIVHGSISNDFNKDRDIQARNVKTKRFHVSREELEAINVPVDMFNTTELTIEGYFEIKGNKYNINNISGTTGNLYVTFYIELR